MEWGEPIHSDLSATLRPPTAAPPEARVLGLGACAAGRAVALSGSRLPPRPPSALASGDSPGCAVRIACAGRSGPCAPPTCGRQPHPRPCGRRVPFSFVELGWGCRPRRRRGLRPPQPGRRLGPAWVDVVAPNRCRDRALLVDATGSRRPLVPATVAGRGFAPRFAAPRGAVPSPNPSLDAV